MFEVPGIATGAEPACRLAPLRARRATCCFRAMRRMRRRCWCGPSARISPPRRRGRQRWCSPAVRVVCRLALQHACCRLAAELQPPLHAKASDYRPAARRDCRRGGGCQMGHQPRPAARRQVRRARPGEPPACRSIDTGCAVRESNTCSKKRDLRLLPIASPAGQPNLGGRRAHAGPVPHAQRVC